MAVVGTIALTTSQTDDLLTKYAIAWTSDAAGAVSGDSVTLKSGELVQVKYDPGTGADVPTNLYDVTLLDTASTDVLMGTGTDCLAASGVLKVPVVSTYFRVRIEGGAYQPVVAAAGNAKKGTITLWVR